MGRRSVRANMGLSDLRSVEVVSMTYTNWLKQQAEIKRLQEEVTALKRFAYEDAPRIAAEEANKQTAELRAEVKRLRDELGCIAMARGNAFTAPGEFRAWAQNRARHALGMKPGEMKIKKG
jgi:cell division protein FtsB